MKSEKFMLINQIIREFALSRMVTFLCEKAGVSPSGYYAWQKAEKVRIERQESDWKDYELIKEIFDEKKKVSGTMKRQLFFCGA